MCAVACTGSLALQGMCDFSAALRPNRSWCYGQQIGAFVSWLCLCWLSLHKQHRMSSLLLYMLVLFIWSQLQSGMLCLFTPTHAKRESAVSLICCCSVVYAGVVMLLSVGPARLLHSGSGHTQRKPGRPKGRAALSSFEKSLPCSVERQSDMRLQVWLVAHVGFLGKIPQFGES
jgi:hypothetical protein